MNPATPRSTPSYKTPSSKTTLGSEGVGGGGGGGEGLSEVKRFVSCPQKTPQTYYKIYKYVHTYIYIYVFDVYLLGNVFTCTLTQYSQGAYIL